MKKYIFIFAILALSACIIDLSVTYSQFTKDDLSHLYYDKDTFIYTGIDILFRDTIRYLLNDTGNINVTVTTKIYSYEYPFPTYIKPVSGRSLMYFKESSGFDYANILVRAGGSEKFFEIGANGTWGFSKQYLNTDTVQLDTANVLGKIYQNVYKFYPPVEGKTDIRLIYFAKKYGYIKIEKTNGTKIERIAGDK
jgi:hypothetical protein